METIKNYLENMFLNLPCTPEVMKAKSELGQMMQDKYRELLAEGKSENEAIGIVISEFGNLEELSEELGIQDAMKAQTGSADAGDRVTGSEIDAYIKDSVSCSYRIALGVMLCIFSVISCILTSDTTGLEEGIGIGIFYLFVAVGIGLFIYSGIRMNVYTRLRHNRPLLDYETQTRVKTQQTAYRPTYTMFLTIGVVLCIVSLIPVSVGGSMGINDHMENALAALMFVFIGIGVFLIVMSSMHNHIYTDLLHEKKQHFDEDTKGLGKTGHTIATVFWPTVTCIYLIVSFLTFRWDITWLIWPVAAVLSALLKSIFSNNTESEDSGR